MDDRIYLPSWFPCLKRRASIKPCKALYRKKKTFCSEEVLAIVCSDIHDGPEARIKSRSLTPKEVEERLSALPPSLRKHFLESMQHNKEMLEELAGM